MSTKNTTTYGYNPAGIGAYNSMIPGFGSTVNSYMMNPFSNPFFQTQQQMGYRTAQQQNQTNMSNISRNSFMSGLSPNNPAMLEMMNNQMRAGTANSANLGFLNPVQNAFTAQQNAMGMAGSFRPLQTSQTQTQSGLGSWLPQLLGAGLGMAGSIFSGGASSAAGGAMSGTMGAMNAALTPMQSPFFGTTGPQLPMGSGAPDVGGGYNFGPSPFMMGSPNAPSY